jgi:hypothetical protein
MDLRTGRVITRKELIVQAVEDMALQKGFATIKLPGDITTNLSCARSQAWSTRPFAGVEYEDDRNNDEDCNPNELAIVECENDDEI